MNRKLFVFDFDSTLCKIETIDEIADVFNLGNDIESITKDAMNGKISFFESLTKRVSLLKNLPYDKVVEICHNLPLNNGAIEVVPELKKLGYKVVVFSGGFTMATNHYKNLLGLDADFSNTLHYHNNTLSGMVGGDMMFDNSKGIMIQKLQNLLGVDELNTAVIGDGANDLSMFKFASTKIAFCAKEILKKNASHTIDDGNLMGILDILNSNE